MHLETGVGEQRKKRKKKSKIKPLKEEWAGAEVSRGLNRTYYWAQGLDGASGETFELKLASFCPHLSPSLSLAPRDGKGDALASIHKELFSLRVRFGAPPFALITAGEADPYCALFKQRAKTKHTRGSSHPITTQTPAPERNKAESHSASSWRLSEEPRMTGPLLTAQNNNNKWIIEDRTGSRDGSCSVGFKARSGLSSNHKGELTKERIITERPISKQ